MSINEGLTILFATPILVAAVWKVARHRKAKCVQSGTSVTQLAEIMRSAEFANNGFFRSLELVQKNLEMLIARAENAEQKLRSLTLQSGGEQRDQYTAAALLLAAGHDIDRVSSMLGLPGAQVQLIRDLQDVSNREKRGLGRNKKADDGTERESTRQSKIAVSKEKTSQRPILLVDVLKNSGAVEDRSGDPSARFKGETV